MKSARETANAEGSAKEAKSSALDDVNIMTELPICAAKDAMPMMVPVRVAGTFIPPKMLKCFNSGFNETQTDRSGFERDDSRER